MFSKRKYPGSACPELNQDLGLQVLCFNIFIFVKYRHNYANRNLNRVMTSLIIVFIIFFDYKPIFKTLMLGKHIAH